MSDRYTAKKRLKYTKRVAEGIICWHSMYKALHLILSNTKYKLLSWKLFNNHEYNNMDILYRAKIVFKNDDFVSFFLYFVLRF